MDKNVFKYVLPEQLVKHFDIESVTELPIPGTKRFQLHVHLVEKNVLPAGYGNTPHLLDHGIAGVS